MRNTLYNLIRDNRNNTTRRISVGITKKISLNQKKFLMIEI